MSTAATYAVILAAYAEQEAKESNCRVIVSAYEPKQATVSQMQEYAGCINTLYPNNMSPEQVIILKIALVVALFGAAFGVFKARAYREDALSTFMFGVIGCLIGGIGALMVALLVDGAGSLFS